ncbi:MAG: PaaI family thioesterase [Beijerinckiaceae bacterium]
MSFDLPAARVLLDNVFAPWVQDLALEIVAVSPEKAVLRMPFSPRLTREGGVVCGQAMMAMADTAMVFAVSAACGAYRPMTTVDQTTHFLKPASSSALIAEAEISRLGKSMAFGRVTLLAESDRKPVATVQTAYALLA